MERKTVMAIIITLCAAFSITLTPAARDVLTTILVATDVSASSN